MSTVLIEETCTGTLKFEFSDKWQVYKYDEQVKDNFYESIKHQGLKAVDFIAISEQYTLLIEVKNIIANDENCKMRLSKLADNELISNVNEKIQKSHGLNNLEKGRVKVISKRPYLAEEVAKKAKDTVLGFCWQGIMKMMKNYPLIIKQFLLIRNLSC